jgi:hypothetical protein
MTTTEQKIQAQLDEQGFEVKARNFRPKYWSFRGPRPQVHAVAKLFIGQASDQATVRGPREIDEETVEIEVEIH